MKAIALFCSVSLWTIIFCVSASGCGSSESMSLSKSEQFASTGSEDVSDFNEIAMNQVPTEGSSLDPEVSEDSAVERKIIYESELRIEVTSFDDIPARVKDIVKAHGGYVASSSLDGISGTRRSGTWVIKIPIRKYADFLDQAGKLGELQSQNENSTEVTAQYYDLEGRIRTKKQEEARMLKHLEEDTAKLEETLAVEKELMRIRTELESMQGRMRLLTHQVDFSTVTLHVQEYRDYQPEQQLGFMAEVQRTFSVSISRLVVFIRTLAIVLVGVLPWVLVLILPAILIVRWCSSWLNKLLTSFIQSWRKWWKIKIQ
ncbi:DUF4349 domain-containing protein [Thalassoglobus polymorphus]|uniref:DUF4349 domain-containing protein n=1 Tax=Thalassoglobus polymorphus TaxID=2527994 RepID=A0A517QKY6_9PLAN|nr:DUF4349 domain-containing protein [Thalassoglobus polymorphus]QDT32274.1 hypothetical protein Mal48_15170 [Thalassoglobus polymorphus]